MLEKVPINMLFRSKAPKTQQAAGCKHCEKPVSSFDGTKRMVNFIPPKILLTYKLGSFTKYLFLDNL